MHEAKAFLNVSTCSQLCKRRKKLSIFSVIGKWQAEPLSCPGISALPPFPQGHPPGSNRHSTVPLSQHYSASQPFPGLCSLSSLQQGNARNISALFSRFGQRYRWSASLLHQPLWNISSEGGMGLRESLLADFSLNIEPIKAPV